MNYAGHVIAGLPLVPFVLFDFLARSLPGGIISISIEWLIGLVSILDIGQTSAVGKSIEMVLAILLTLAGLSVFGGLYAITLQRINVHWVLRGIIAGLFIAALATLIANWGGWGKPGQVMGMLWLLLTCILWGCSLAWAIDQYQLAMSDEINTGRRKVLGQLAIGSLTMSGIFVLLGRWLEPEPAAPPVAGKVTTPQPTEPLPTPPPTKAGFTPVPGTRPEITPIEDFYRVDINLLPPGDAEFLDSADPLVQRLLEQGGETDLPADSYVLVVDGLLKNSLALTLTDIKSFPMVEHYATLECISNPVGGDLISTTLFQGTRLKDILESAGLEESVVDIKFTCVDGYSESLPLQAAMHPETLLCYAMGNKPLTQNHGAPIRLYTPNRFGVKNPKWIIKIEAIDTDYKGFWPSRGWSESALVKTTAVIDTHQAGSANQVLVGGIAFAGARGIQSVELRVDEGPWVAAEIDRPVSPLTWILWRTSVDLTPGQYSLSVRATDGGGQLQTEKVSRAHPSGASGYHTINITI